MTLQLRAISIYSLDGERRDMAFELGRLNIVTGASKTGKSALLDIVDYCWGRDECTIAEGEIRRSVSWFAVLFDNQGEGIFIARRNPGPGGRGDDHIYFERNVDELPRTTEHFHQNVTSAALRTHLSQILGIAENLYLPEPGATRVPLSATASQAIFFSLQAQDEIANRRLLFHRQGEPHIPSAIKDTLPYFLGAMEEDYYLKQRRYDEARARLRKLERDWNELRSLTTSATTATQSLLQDAKRVGLVEVDNFPEGPETLRAVLAEATAPRELQYAKTDDAAADLTDLEDRRRLLRGQLVEIREEHAQFAKLERDASDFEFEAREQEARLASIGLVAHADGDQDSCPLCDSKLAVPVPSVSAIRDSLRGVGAQVTSVRRDTPRVQAHIAQLEKRRAELEEQLKEVQRDITTRIADNERLRIEQDQFTEQARVAGRIGYYLENVQAVPRQHLWPRFEVVI